MAALKIRDLYKSFRSDFYFKNIAILKNINLTVEKGQIYGFLGPNGAGKTTTIKCVLGLLFPDSGESLVFGKPSSSIEGRSKLGVLPEHPYFYDYLTPLELLQFYGMIFSISKKHIKEKSERLMKLVGLSGKENLKLRKFSKGMIQRVGLAQALINDPEIIILDEPFSGLDPIGRKELRDIIIGLKEAGKTIFFSSHILQDMEMISDKVGIILNGRMIKEGILSELVSHSVNYYEIVFSGVDEKKLMNNGIKYTRRENFICISNTLERVNHIIEFIIMNKGKIIAVTPVKMTLEEIFLKEIENEAKSHSI